jgi:transcriptional regulator of acetoin/glycerol metabolism
MSASETTQLTERQRRKLHSFMRAKQGNLKLAKQLMGISENTLKRSVLGGSITPDTLAKIKTVLPKLK